MKRILFVDDEQRVLDGLKRMLHRQRNEWHMMFALGGQAALNELASAPYDIIVTDMRMPGIDGAHLLTRVQKDYPHLVRIVLSGHTEMEAALRTVPVAHQFLAKPCEPDRLREVVDRALSLQKLLGDPKLRTVINSIQDLPVLPKVYQTLTAALVNPQTSAKDVATIIEQDVSLCAKILQLVNSAFFGLPRRVNNIQNAVSYLGVQVIKNLTLSMEVFRALEGQVPAGYSLERLQTHSLLVGNLARRLLSDKRDSEDAFIAGILHDIGEYVLIMGDAERFGQVINAARASEHPRQRVELVQLGVTHAEIGGYLLGVWGLPYPIVEAVANHHAPERSNSSRFDVNCAVYLADTLIQDTPEADQAQFGPPEPLNLEMFKTVGVAEKLPAWRLLAQEQLNNLR